MSSLLYLNKNLTLQQAIELHKMSLDGHAKVQKTFDYAMAKCKTREEKEALFSELYPILMSSLISVL